MGNGSLILDSIHSSSVWSIGFTLTFRFRFALKANNNSLIHFLIMAQYANNEEILAKAIADAKKFDTEIVSGEEAVKVGDKKQNTDYSVGGGLCEGDEVTFPRDEKEFVKCSLAKGESMSLMCVVTRKGKAQALRIYDAWLTNVTHPVTDETTKAVDENDWVKHSGEPAEYARAVNGSKADMFRAFVGTSIKVTNVRKVKVLGIKRGVTVARGERLSLDKQAVTPKKFYTYEWITAPTTAPTTAPAEGGATAEGATAEGGATA